MFGKNHLMRQLLALLVLVLTVGTVGYRILEDGWTLFDGLYMTMITLTTIGFGEVHELSDKGRILTLFIIVFGLGSAATIFTQLAQLMMEGNFFAAWRKRRMDKELFRLVDHVIICGYGRIGEAICRDLTGMGVPCVIVERDDDHARAAAVLNVPTLTGNATSDMVLLNAGVKRARILVAALPNEADNLFVALAARDLNQELTVIARGEDKASETRMLRAGVDRVVYPAQLGGGQIARLIGAEMGKEILEASHRRETDLLGYDLQVYRNFEKAPITVEEVMAKTGALRAVAHVDADGTHHPEPPGEKSLAPQEALVLLTEAGAQGTDNSDPDDPYSQLDRSLSVGIPSMDEDHQHILHLIGRLKTARRDGSDRTREILTELRERTARHFQHEEQIFLSVGFPLAEEHIAEHRDLVAKLDQMLSDRGRQHAANLNDVLNAWVTGHILKSDREYAEYLQCVTPDWG